MFAEIFEFVMLFLFTPFLWFFVCWYIAVILGSFFDFLDKYKIIKVPDLTLVFILVPTYIILVLFTWYAGIRGTFF